VRVVAVDVGSAVGYLDLDISGFLAGLKSAQSEAETSTKKLEAIGNKFVSVGDKIAGVGTKLTTAITVPLTGAVTAAVKGYADMEQAIGGIETLFKNNASYVITNAETAYKRAGTSATDYMEQITSFSASLLQSVGGDTRQAAKIADMAMVDMSDNANKFGTSIELIQNAYQGFAKQNYTMLDNLKLGYGGTKTEMERLLADAEKLTGIKYDISNLDDVYTAIHVIQEELGVAGTTALEATETISGSFGMAKAAISDFLANLGKPGADMEQFKNNMVESITIFVNNIKNVLATIWENIPLEGWQKNLIAAAAAAGPLLLVIGKLTSGVGSIITTFGKIPGTIAKVKSAFTVVSAAIGGISAPVIAIVAVIGVLITAFATLWKTNEEFRNKMIGIWNKIKETVGGFLQGIVDRVNALGFDFKNIADMLWSIWKGFCDLLAPIFEGVFQQIVNILDVAFDVILGILDIFIGIFTGNWKQVWEGIKGIFKGIWDFLVATFQNWINIFMGLADAILGWFGTTWENTWNNIKQFFIDIWNGIVNFFSNMINSIETAVSNFVTTIITFFSQLPTNIANFITNAYNSVVTWVKNMVAKAGEMGQNFLNAVISFLTQLPGKVKEFLDSVIESVKIWVSQMGQKGRESIESLISNIVDAAKDIPSKMAEIGKSIVEGVWNGIKNAASWFTSQVKSFFSGIVDSVKNALGIGSPSKVFRDEIGKWLPLGVVQGFEAAMPSAMEAIQKDLNKGINNIDVDDISISADITISEFADKLKSIYNEIALWFESIESRIGNSVDSMMQSLDMLIRTGKVIVNSDGTLGYIGYNGFTKSGGSEGYVDRTNSKDKNASGNGDTFIFYSPKAIDEIEAAKQMKKAKQDMAEGF
jgi:phage-related protein